MNEKELALSAYEHEGCVYVDEEIFKKACLVNYDGKKYAVNPNAMLTINCTTRCNARCSFCYNAITFMRDEQYVEADSEELQRAITFARDAHIKVATLTGGEPTLVPEKLIKLAIKLNKSGFPIIRMHTNGFLLNSEVDFEGKKEKLWKHLVDAGVNNISLSLADYRTERNSAIMRMDNKAAIEKYIGNLVADNVQIRLSCYMCEEGISTYDDVVNYINYGLSNNIKNYIFRISTKDNLSGTIPVEKLANRLEKEGWEIKYHHKKTDSLIYELKSGDIKVALSCVEEEIDKDKKVRRLIYMPDKVVYTSWIDSSSFLFDDDADKIVALAKKEDESKGGSYPGHIWNIQAVSELAAKDDFDADGHVHSMVSDGLYSPSQVIRNAADAGMKQIVFAEHNCLHDNPELLREIGRKYGVEIPLLCVEYNAVYCEDKKPLLKAHMLIYGTRKEQFDFMKSMYNPNSPRNDYAKAKYKELHDAGIISELWDEIYSIPEDETGASRQMFLRGPLAKAIALHEGISADEAKEKYLPKLPESKRYENYVDAETLIKKAHESGCAAVWAHPGWVRPYDGKAECDLTDVLRAITKLAKIGLDGVEVSHRLNDLETRQQLFKLATLLGLIVTGGSDYHGKPACCFKTNGITHENLSKLMERIK